MGRSRRHRPAGPLLLFDSVIKLMQIQPVKDSFTELGYPLSLAPVIGTIELVCLAL